jgi:hypothetical protein
VIFKHIPTTFSIGRGNTSLLVDVHVVSDVRQKETHTAELLAPDFSASEFELTIAKLKRHTSPGSDQILAELIQAGDETIQSEIHI